MWKVVLSVTASALWAVPAPARAAAPDVVFTSEAGASGVVVVATAVVAPAEAELMSLIVTQTNQRRRAAGCDRLLDVDPELVVASLRQSDYMADTGTFSHIGRDGSTFAARARAAGYAAPAGENIGWGYRSATEVMDAWMASPAHRRNILDCGARAVGTGVRFAADGTAYYTEVFGRR